MAHASRIKKEVAILLSENIDFKSNWVKREKKGYYRIKRVSSARGNDNSIYTCILYVCKYILYIGCI